MNTTFADLGIPPEILNALHKQGFEAPFEIQITTIPDALAGRDVCGRAATGSGKTLAFGIPLVATLAKARPHYPRGLVLAPTRELAEQIRNALMPLAKARGLKVAAIYGGVGYGDQRRALRGAVDILVACPGRLADLIQQADVHLAEVDHVVIDEADRMADMGFLPEVRRLLDRTSKKRQTVLFSATLDDEVAIITRDYQTNPVTHHVGELEPDIHSAQHHFWQVHREERMDTAFDVVIAFERTIVFSRTRRGADRIAKRFNRFGNVAASIHGQRTQGQRNRALEAFKKGKVRCLVATDVAARGIHVDDVDCVLHFDIPGDEKAYLHRSGRTARAGGTGVVVSLILEDQIDDLRAMQRALGLYAPLGRPAPKQLTEADGTPVKAPTADKPVASSRDRANGAGRSGSGRSGGGGRSNGKASRGKGGQGGRGDKHGGGGKGGNRRRRPSRGGGGNAGRGQGGGEGRDGGGGPGPGGGAPRGDGGSGGQGEGGSGSRGGGQGSGSKHGSGSGSGRGSSSGSGGPSSPSRSKGNGAGRPKRQRNRRRSGPSGGQR
jgi:superfamily II DNA/RNA helicase